MDDPGETTSRRLLPPPARNLLLQAARGLAFLEWEVVRRHEDAGKVEARGPALADLELQPLPPSTGTPKVFAETLVVQAACGIADGISQRQLQAWENAQPQNRDDLERERAVLHCARSHICRQVEALAEHGEYRDGGGWQEAYHALTRLAAEHRASILSPEAHSAKAELAGAGDPAATPKRSTLPKQPSIPLTKVALPRDERELRRALKYVFSTGIGVSLAVISVAPLRLALVPASTFQRRFEAILSGGGARSVRDRAQTVMLRAVKRIVEDGLTDDSLRTWLPSVAWDRLAEPDVERHAVEVLTQEVQRRLDAALTEWGSDWFERYATGGN